MFAVQPRHFMCEHLSPYLGYLSHVQQMGHDKVEDHAPTSGKLDPLLFYLLPEDKSRNYQKMSFHSFVCDASTILHISQGIVRVLINNIIKILFFFFYRLADLHISHGIVRVLTPNVKNVWSCFFFLA